MMIMIEDENHIYGDLVAPYAITFDKTKIGNLLRKAPDTLIQTYLAVPQNIRNAFKSNGFIIKMTEWDVKQEAALSALYPI